MPVQATRFVTLGGLPGGFVVDSFGDLVALPADVHLVAGPHRTAEQTDHDWIAALFLERLESGPVDVVVVVVSVLGFEVILQELELLVGQYTDLLVSSHVEYTHSHTRTYAKAGCVPQSIGAQLAIVVSAMLNIMSDARRDLRVRDLPVEGAMSTVEETVRAYVEAWYTLDEHRRRELVRQCWSENGSYMDPNNTVQGRDALVSLIAGFHQSSPGARIPTTSGVDGHHGMLRFSWVLLRPDGTRREGLDIGELDDQGLLRRITGFFGPLPPVPDDWSAELVDRSQ